MKALDSIISRMPERIASDMISRRTIELTACKALNISPITATATRITAILPAIGQTRAPKPLNINHLGAGTIKILLFHTLFIMKKTEKLGLPPTGKIGVFRRWLGIYSKEEREVLDYARKLKKTTMQIARGQQSLLSRPYWMRHEDWVEVRKLQTKLERRRRK